MGLKNNVSNNREELELMQEILEIAKTDRQKAREILGGLKTMALYKMKDPLFAKRVDEWMRLV